MQNRILGALVVLAVASTVQAQTPPATPLVGLTALERDAIVKAYPARRSTRAKSFDADKQIVELYVDQLVRGPQAGAPAVHHGLTELYYIVEGAAIMVTGRKLIMPDPQTTSSAVVGQIEDGVARRVSAGDVVVNTPGTFHQWKTVESSTFVYIGIHVDPEKKTTPGYVDPALKK